MEIYVNDNKVDYQPMFPLTWGNFFQKMLQDNNMIQKDHGIVRIILDGVDKLEVMIEQSDQMVPDTIFKVEIFTQDSLAITRNGSRK